MENSNSQMETETQSELKLKILQNDYVKLERENERLTELNEEY